MATRKQALELIKNAAAQGDMKSATRHYIENRVSMEAFRNAVREGQHLASGLAAGRVGPGMKSAMRADALRNESADAQLGRSRGY